MLYRECRFQVAYELFQQAAPGITEAEAFLKLGGIGLELCPMNIGKTQFYLLTGGCAKLSFEVFFQQFQIEHTKITVDDLIQSYDSDTYYYVIPISRSMLSKETESLSELEKSMTGHSYALIRGIDLKKQRILLNDLSPLKEYSTERESTHDWVSINLCRTIFEECTGSYYPLKIHCIRKEALTANDTIQAFRETDLSAQMIKNLEYMLENGQSQIDHVSIKGIQAYDMLCRHLLKLKQLLEEHPDANIEKYIRIQMVFLRFFIASGSDSCYRDEFIDCLEKIRDPYMAVQDQILEEWKETAGLWRRIGRLLAKLHVRFEQEAFEQMVDYFCMIKDKEINLIERTLISFGGRVTV